MSQDNCAICLDAFEKFHQIAKPEPCQHSFHVSCLNHWLLHNRTCPLCRTNISYETQANWQTLLAVAFVFSREMQIERCVCALAFLNLVLDRFPTGQAFKEHREQIIGAIEHLQITNVRLPFLAIPTRTDALKERKRWRLLAETLLEGPLKKERIDQFKQHIQINL